MHCYICDREDDLISYHKVHKEYSPCLVCQAIIDDCIAGYDDIYENGPPEEEWEAFELWDLDS